MLIPRFTIRRLFGITAVCGIFFLIVSFAVRGHLWAASISVALAGLLVLLLVHALFFSMSWVTSLLVGVVQGMKAARSPFAQDTPPPQIIPPEDPE